MKVVLTFNETDAKLIKNIIKKNNILIIKTIENSNTEVSVDVENFNKIFSLLDELNKICTYTVEVKNGISLISSSIRKRFGKKPVTTTQFIEDFF